jgi:hypothetical protein
MDEEPTPAVFIEPMTAVFKEPVAAVFNGTLKVVDKAMSTVLFWNGASEAIDEEPVAAVFKEPINTVAVFKGTLEVVDKAISVVLFWKGAPEVSGVGTTLPEGEESVVPFDEDSTRKAEHMLTVLLPEMNSPV